MSMTLVFKATQWLLNQAGGRLFNKVADNLAIKMGIKPEPLTKPFLEDYLQCLEDRIAQRVIAHLDEDRLITLRSGIGQLRRSSKTGLKRGVLNNALNDFSRITQLPEQGETGGFPNAQLRSVAFLGIAAVHLELKDSKNIIAENIVAAIYADSSTAEQWLGKDVVQELLTSVPWSEGSPALTHHGYFDLTQKVVLPERALGAPALVNFDNMHLLLAWTGTDEEHHLCVASSLDGYTFDSRVALGETSIDGPGFTCENGQAFLAWTGSNPEHHLSIISSHNLREFGEKVVLGETSPYAPALAFGNGRLYLAWTGTDHNHTLCLMSSTDGRHFTNKVTLRETSSSGPALCFIDGRLYLLWCGTDQNHSLCILESTDGVRFKNKVCLGEESDGHPVLVKQNVFFLVWTGRDPEHHLNVRISGSTIVDLHSSSKMLYADTSVAGPTLVNFKGRLYLGWAGTDDAHHISIAMLS